LEVSLNLLYLICTFLISFFTSFISLPFIINISIKKKFLDFPDDRKQSRKPLPRIGGLSILIGIFSSLIYLNFNKDLNLGIGDIQTLLTLSIGFFVIGFIDDLFNISPWPRLLTQISLASIAWSQNIRIESIDLTYLNIGMDFYVLPKFLSLLITIIWIVGLTNAINWIDGLDGLATGVTLIGIFGLLIINLKLRQYDTFFILIPISGSCLAFLKYNFYPAKILMGDGGSYLLGFLLSLVSIISTTRYPFGNSETFATAIYVPMILFSIPIFDMCSVILSRILNGRSPFYPDQEHIHHKFMSKGLDHRDTVLLIYLFSVFAASLSISLVI